MSLPIDELRYHIARLATLIHFHLLQSIIPSNTFNSSAVGSFYLHMISQTNASISLVLMSLKFLHILMTRPLIYPPALIHELLPPPPESEKLTNSCAAVMGFPSSQPPTDLRLSPRLLIIVTMMLSKKVMEDTRVRNVRWAELGGVDLQTLNCAEREVLAAMGYQLSLSERQFSDWVEFVVTKVGAIDMVTDSKEFSL
ncbi:hypothetical protein HK096_007992 [Nowakowskiella sp. JEL0078]|nr:hypothetical protein HK096_007992 [Nowakowskiella sp. JEL0078]